MKEREFWIDAVRTFACICVLTTHAPIPTTESGRIFIPIYNFAAVGGASILFFMISGALVLYKQQELVPFIKKRLSRVVLPMIFWTFISLCVACIEGKIEGKEIITKMLLVPFAPQVGTYWFIYVIFGIYLLTPILSTWLAQSNKRTVEYYLGIWAITLFLPFFNHEDISSMIGFSTGYLYQFYGFTGFAVLGYYLRKYCFNNSPFCWKFVLFPFCILSIVFLIYPTNLIDHGILQDRMSFHTVLLASSYFLLIKKLPLTKWMKKFVYIFAQHSFGIYLVHIIVMRSILWPLFIPLEINHLIAIPLITCLTALISFSIVWIFGKLVPGSKYLVGV